MPISRSSPANTGLTLAELAWTLGLLVAVTALILGTLEKDIEEARNRRASAALDYLTASLYLEIKDIPSGALPAILLGPGKPPAGISQTESLLQTFVSSNCFLPIDPWGRSYVLKKYASQGNWRILCAGPNNTLPRDSKPSSQFSRELITPSHKKIQ